MYIHLFIKGNRVNRILKSESNSIDSFYRIDRLGQINVHKAKCPAFAEHFDILKHTKQSQILEISVAQEYTKMLRKVDVSSNKQEVDVSSRKLMYEQEYNTYQ